jgi:hypothetical protein
MEITKEQLKQAIKEEFDREDIAEMIRLLGQINRKLETLEDVDRSIDYLTSAMTGLDPFTIQAYQGAGQRRRTPVVKAESTKITKPLLKQIIKEEVAAVLAELEEAAYEGNIGKMEMFQFQRDASPRDKQLMDQLLKAKEFGKAWELLKRVSGVKLHDPKDLSKPEKPRRRGGMGAPWGGRGL